MQKSPKHRLLWVTQCEILRCMQSGGFIQRDRH